MDPNIERLATALGITADNLWAVLVRQAPVTALTHALILASLTFVFLRTLRWAKSTPKDQDMLDDEAYTALRWICTVMMGLMVLIEAANSLPIIVAGIFNPEYVALWQVLDALSGS